MAGSNLYGKKRVKSTDKDERLKELGLTPKKEPKKNKKIPREVRREIRHRAKKEAGLLASKNKKSTSTPVGRALRKAKGALIGKPNRYGLKLGGSGADLPLKRENPPVKKKETVQVKARRFTSLGGQVGESKFYDASSQEEMDAQTKKAVNEAGGKYRKPTPKNPQGDVGVTSGVYERNKKKSEEEKKNKYNTGDRTKEQLAYDKEMKKGRTDSIKSAKGKVGKGERIYRAALKKKYKKQYKEGTYKRR
tara:strand:+ start:6595 stop:7341 length:747 start_codon:yes stop_codon:yes gene_type:complete